MNNNIQIQKKHYTGSHRHAPSKSASHRPSGRVPKQSGRRQESELDATSYYDSEYATESDAGGDYVDSG
jgi:hypothetical protein